MTYERSGRIGTHQGGDVHAGHSIGERLLSDHADNTGDDAYPISNSIEKESEKRTSDALTRHDSGDVFGRELGAQADRCTDEDRGGHTWLANQVDLLSVAVPVMKTQPRTTQRVQVRPTVITKIGTATRTSMVIAEVTTMS